MCANSGLKMKYKFVCDSVIAPKLVCIAVVAVTPKLALLYTVATRIVGKMIFLNFLTIRRYWSELETFELCSFGQGVFSRRVKLSMIIDPLVNVVSKRVIMDFRLSHLQVVAIWKWILYDQRFLRVNWATVEPAVRQYNVLSSCWITYKTGLATGAKI